MNRQLIAIMAIGIISIASLFSMAYAVDNNCMIRVTHLLQMPIALGCIEDRLDALENAPAGSGNATILNDLGDVIITAPIDNQFLRYDGIKWINESVSGGLGNATVLNDLGDVTIISPSTNQILQYNGTQWVNINHVVWENNTASNLGVSHATSEGIFASKVGIDLQFKRLFEGSNIAMSSNSTHITIAVTGINSDDTICANVGSGSNVFKDGECNFRSVIGSSDISVTQQTNTITIDFNGSSSGSVQIAQLQFLTDAQITKTNIGNAYVDVYNNAFDFEQLARIHGANVTYYRINYQVDYVGTGTQQYRWVDANNNANVLAEASTITGDCLECATAWFIKPAFVGDSEFVIEMQGKSTVAGDDPIVRGYQIHAK